LYARDANTDEAGRIARKLGGPLYFTALQKHELFNAFRLAVFRNDITADQCHILLETVESDMKAGVLAETPVAWTDIYAEAESLSAACTAQFGARASDILHVATALVLGTSVFCSFDVRQKVVAQKAGMTVNSRKKQRVGTDLRAVHEKTLTWK